MAKAALAFPQGFYWGTATAWHSGRSPHLGARTLVLPSWAAVDIDTPFTTSRLERLLAVMRAEQHDPAQMRQVLSAESYYMPVSDSEADITKVMPVLK